MTDWVERRWTSTDGLSLRARDRPGQAGPARLPVIAIHGLTRNAADFETIAPDIAASGRRVLSVDVRGRGRSDYAADPMTYQPLVYAQDMLALMDQAGLGQAVFLGTSMGGLITMALAAIRPQAIGAAIVNDVGPEVDPTGLARIAAYAGKAAPVSDWASAAAYIKGLNAVALPHYSDADWDAFARRTFKTGPEGLPKLDYDPDIMVPIRAAGPDALVPDLWPMWTALAKDRPTLLIHGAISDLLNDDIAGRMKDAAPDLIYARVPDVGHAPMLDEPVARTAILEFLATCP